MLSKVLAKPLIKPSSRFSSTLVVPFTHLGISQFSKGVPAEQVRELLPAEKQWDFWTSSNAQDPYKPTLGWVSIVPHGEIWVMERSGKYTKTLQPGLHFVIPFLDKVKAVKTPFPVVNGIIAKTTSHGNPVHVYAVAHMTVVDPVKSAFYTESSRKDGENCLSKDIQSILMNEVKSLKIVDGNISEVDQKALLAKIMDHAKTKEAATGVKLDLIEFRGVFAESENVPDKLRALNPPLVDPDTPGHNLSNDYWADHVLTPPFFEKRKFGSEKEARTPAAVSLEWSVPSPPDYHHFNMVPKVTVAPPADCKVEKAAH